MTRPRPQPYARPVTVETTGEPPASPAALGAVLDLLARCARYRHDDTLGWLCDVWAGRR